MYIYIVDSTCTLLALHGDVRAHRRAQQRRRSPAPPPVLVPQCCVCGTSGLPRSSGSAPCTGRPWTGRHTLGTPGMKDRQLKCSGNGVNGPVHQGQHHAQGSSPWTGRHRLGTPGMEDRQLKCSGNGVNGTVHQGQYHAQGVLGLVGIG